jgi:hypothetical protein
LEAVYKVNKQKNEDKRGREPKNTHENDRGSRLSVINQRSISASNAKANEEISGMKIGSLVTTTLRDHKQDHLKSFSPADLIKRSLSSAHHHHLLLIFT